MCARFAPLEHTLHCLVFTILSQNPKIFSFNPLSSTVIFMLLCLVPGPSDCLIVWSFCFCIDLITRRNLSKSILISYRQSNFNSFIITHSVFHKQLDLAPDVKPNSWGVHSLGSQAWRYCPLQDHLYLPHAHCALLEPTRLCWVTLLSVWLKSIANFSRRRSPLRSQQ